ncbi:huntingtin-interacting protein K-like [Dysidea avara]|uniref:huntingtin-interacting protein K-like n=1 Tax=Dysidea avara TaxID=196820 RepID=UPI00332A9E01
MAVAAATAPAAAVPLSQKTHDSVGAADLEKVTDYAPEKEISGDIGKAVSLIEEQESKEKVKKAKKDQELAKIKIRKEDVELIVKEFEISRTAAERSLRENEGDIIKALRALTD